MIGSRVRAAILAAVAAAAAAGSACHDEVGAPSGGAASDGPSEATEDGATSPEDSTTGTPQDGGTSSGGPGDGGPDSPSEARAPVDAASDAGRADATDAANAGGCGPLPRGADVAPVLYSTTGMTVPMPAGGVLPSGTYVMTASTSYANPIFATPCGTLPVTARATYRITAGSATTGIVQEDLGSDYGDAGVSSSSLFAASYSADVDAGSALLEEVCPVDAGTGAIGVLVYTVTPTGLLVFSSSTAGARVMCTTVDTLTKQ